MSSTFPSFLGLPFANSRSWRPSGSVGAQAMLCSRRRGFTAYASHRPLLFSRSPCPTRRCDQTPCPARELCVSAPMRDTSVTVKGAAANIDLVGLRGTPSPFRSSGWWSVKSLTSEGRRVVADLSYRDGLPESD
ncbi:hypothetical protein BD310DRAFT_936069 [Dichomitus squalens]|uniref:Uncharacterized protein n=1 Tax=Dichomitus squalens TaxID=114155 RepID=A0A4Q9PJU8_9APHY|nr:hypothetical protein BD310DRAFT_936069 [Dichomitus squalens]